MLETIGIIGIAFGLMFVARWVARKQAEADEVRRVQRVSTMDKNLARWAEEDELKQIRK